jgi:hypothetical protein
VADDDSVYVANYYGDSVTVYGLTASGNAFPSVWLYGPQISLPSPVALQ